jgi:hypothetical protein
MNKYYKTDVEGYVKDMSSGAILNVDHNKLDAYKKQKKFFDDQKKDTDRLNKVENDISEIKQMLQQLLKR